MTIKCLAFDLDGTLLLDESKRMDPRTVDSIQRAMAQENLEIIFWHW